MHLYPAVVVYLTALTVKPAMENLGPFKSLIRLNRIKHLWLKCPFRLLDLGTLTRRNRVKKTLPYTLYLN